MTVAAEALSNLTELGTPAEEIKWRLGPGGKQLAYVDARYVMRVLDSPLIGPENWQCQYALGDGGKVACGIGINVDGDWLWKWDGAGETDIEGEKGSFSDAFKRAAVRWGIARDLYSLAPQSAGPSTAPAATPPPAGQAQPAGGTPLTTAADGPGGKCPYHGFAWKNGKYGWFCSGKIAKGGPMNKNGYCDAKPSAEWVAAQG